MCSCEGTCTSKTHQRRLKRSRAAARKRRGCWRKKAYPTRDEALADAVKLQNRDKRKRWVYSDCGCGSWHVTSQPPKGI